MRGLYAITTGRKGVEDLLAAANAAREPFSGDPRGSELLLLEDGNCLRDHALEACGLTRGEVDVPYHTTSPNTVVQMVANRIGITLIPRMAMQSNILSGADVVTRSFIDRSVQRSIGLMWRSHSPRRDEFPLFGDLIQKLQSGSVDSPSGLAV